MANISGDHHQLLVRRSYRYRAATLGCVVTCCPARGAVVGVKAAGGVRRTDVRSRDRAGDDMASPSSDRKQDRRRRLDVHRHTDPWEPAAPVKTYVLVPRNRIG